MSLPLMISILLADDYFMCAPNFFVVDFFVKNTQVVAAGAAAAASEASDSDIQVFYLFCKLNYTRSFSNLLSFLPFRRKHPNMHVPAFHHSGLS
jgi:hypothetical protein